MAAKVHFVGVGGCGMSALAQFHVMGGGAATGSDRLLDRGGIDDIKTGLESLGVKLFHQDGSGVGADTAELVASTAIEDDNLDLARARELGLPVVHRAEALARHVAGHRSLAVAGTSGKSTVAAMAFEILELAGRSPSVITGAPLNSLKSKGLVGNAWKGSSNLLVVEADESDGTLPKYAPQWGVLLNLSKDHKEVSELRELFAGFKRRSERFVVTADGQGLEGFLGGGLSFGFEAGDLRGEGLEVDGRSSRFSVGGTDFAVPLPGRYNAENALAAAAVCMEAGVELKDSAAALAQYQGVERRFERVGEAGGVEVIDDYAHNPDKVRAVFGAAHARAERVLAVYQLHGFAPTRFLAGEFIEAFDASLEGGDALWLPPIYYVGGTTVMDVSSDTIAAPLRSRGNDVRSPGDRGAVAEEIAREARPGDTVLVLGARDPTLGAFAREILAALEAAAGKKGG